METFAAEFLDRSPCGAEVITCRFTRPRDYRFRAGQFLMLGVETADGSERKPFTIASAPRDEWLEITTRASGSAFKMALLGLSPKDGVTISPPAGKLALPQACARVGFLAGGVGITPVRSMLRDLVQSGGALDAILLYGNRDVSCMPYAGELDAMAPHGIRTVHVLQYPPEPWEGEGGFITAGLVDRLADNRADMTWVLTGPPAMVEAMMVLLNELGVDPDRRIVERFSGYA